MIRSFVARASALLASAALAFLFIAPVALPSAQGKTLNFPDACTVTIDGSGNLTMICGSNPPPSTFNCSITNPPPSQVPLGYIVRNMTMSCASGTLPYTYSWNTGATSATLPDTQINANTTFSVIATDSAIPQASSSQQVPITIQSAPPPPPPAGGLCTQYANVLPTVNATWGQPGSWLSRQSGNFGDNSVWVFKLTVPNETPTSFAGGNFGAAEYQGPNTLREMTISKEPCDFRPRDYRGVDGPLAVSHGTFVQVIFAVQTPQLFGGIAGLTAGQTYYINVRNWQLDPTPQSSCGATSCPMIMGMQPALP